VGTILEMKIYCGQEIKEFSTLQIVFTLTARNSVKKLSFSSLIPINEENITYNDLTDYKIRLPIISLYNLYRYRVVTRIK
jgi:hypothetical protein